jgi:hypothetical protein
VIGISEKQYSDEDLEEKLDEAFKKSERKPNVFRIIRNETNAIDMKEKRMKAKFKPNKRTGEPDQ